MACRENEHLEHVIYNQIFISPSNYSVLNYHGTEIASASASASSPNRYYLMHQILKESHVYNYK